jgi:ribosomal protein S18 acetylase RimI-like enzyme
MSRPEIVPFAAEHLDAAGELLAARHRRHREVEPLLPERYEDPAAARAEIEALGGEGVVALRDGRVVGYLVAIRKDDEVWGPNAWVESAGHAVERSEDVRDLYAVAAAGWAAAGRKAHYAVVPASDAELVDAWFRLGFGQQHAYGIRELPETGWPNGVREARGEDVDALMELGPLLGQHQELAPTFSTVRKPQDEAEERAELEADVANPDYGTLVAERDGHIVGALDVVPLELSSMHTGLARPEEMSFLAFAVTRPDARGHGAGLALTQAAFAWAREHGYEAMVTDWRVTNLLSSRFWTARGFRTTFFRLHRLIA